MGVFHVFKIVQMVPNRATHHIYKDFLDITEAIFVDGKYFHQVFSSSVYSVKATILAVASLS